MIQLKTRNISLFFFSLLAACFLTIKVASAQEEIKSSDLVLQKQRLAQEITNTKNKLIEELEQYSQDEKQYGISLAQFRKLQTLNSIETATKIAKKAILSRNLVLDTYLNLMRLKLVEAEGIEVVHKEKVLNEIENHRQALVDFEEKVVPIEDRDNLNLLATQFLPLGNEIRDTAYYALSLLAVGKLQAVYDQAYAIEQKVEQKDVSDLSNLEQAERTRATAEVKKLVTQLPPEFEELWTDLAAVENSHSDYKRFYRSVFDDLDLIYSQLSRLTAYLEELEQLK